MIEKPSMMDKAMQTKIGKPNLFVCARCFNTWEEHRMARDGVSCVECKSKNERPPLGLRPRHIADKQRQIEIADAITRYVDAGYKIPLIWIDEYNELADRLK